MKILLCILSFTAVLAACGKSAPQDTGKKPETGFANYTVFGHDEHHEFYMSRYTVLSDGGVPLDDLVTSVKFCPPSVPYVCAYGDFFTFAVPKRQLTVSDEWDFAGLHYRVIPTSMVTIPGGRVAGTEQTDWGFQVFGAEHHTYVIEASSSAPNPQHCRQTYMYSFEQGLLGESSACDDYSSTSLLAGDYGYGSNRFNRLIYPDAFLSEAEALKLLDKHYLREARPR